MRAVIGILGQSNEQGPGPAAVSANKALGCPHGDTVPPKGGSNEMWPFAAEYAGMRGRWYQFRNHAIGATNLSDVWVGRARNYTTNMLVINGCYVISGGRIYKAVGSYGYVCVQPSPPPAAPTPSGSSTFTWTDLGPVTSEDTDGKIYSEESSRFDPNGLIAGIYADLNPMVGYDKKAVLVSIGQGDKTMRTTRSQYSEAMQIVANYFTSRGIYVFLGFTCYSATSDPELWYDTYLMPGRLDALAALSGNRMVMAGANLREALGVLPIEPPYGNGLQADLVHMTPNTMPSAARAWDDAFSAAGW